MQVISLSHSPTYFWVQAIYVEAALLCLESTAPLAAPITALINEFSGLHATDLESRRKIAQAAARGEMADYGLDDGTRHLHSDTLAEVRQDRKAPVFTTLFKTSIYDVVRFALTRQIKIVQDLVDTLNLSIIPDSLRSKHHPKLVSLLDQATQALENRRNVAFHRTQVRLDLTEWKNDVNAALLAVYGQLLALGASSGKSKAWADTFFPKAATKQLSDADEEDTTTDD